MAASGLLWTPLASCKALHWTHAWALLGEWSGHIAFPLPTLADDGSHNWPRHGTACLLQPEFRKRLPPFVGWAYPAFEQGALAPLVFLPANFPIIVLPGDKMFQSRDVSPDYQMAPITHAYGGSKTRVGRALRIKGQTAIMPVQVTLIGGDGKLPLWAHPDGCDFIRGSRLVNQTLMAPAQALSAMEVACLQTLWREVVHLAVGTPIWQVGLYDVPVLSLPDAILALGPSTIHIFHQVQGTYPAGTVEAESQLHLFKDEWAGWNEDQKRTFHGRWCYTVATSSLLLTEQLRTPIRIEFSGLGGSHVLEEPFVADLFVKCMPSAPCYGRSLAYVDRKETDTMWATSIGRTAQTHEYHMLHEAAWPFGVFAWQRILCQWDQDVLPTLEPGLLMTRACSLAAMGSKCPAHQREPHPGYQNALRLFMMTLQPAPLVHYVQHLLIPACPSPTGWPFGLDLHVEVEVRAIGHSAGSYGAMVLAAVLEERTFAKTSGSTKVTAIAMPKSLLTRRYRRQVKLVRVEKDELCVWHPRAEDLATLGQNGIQVTNIEGAIHWFGGKKHNYGHFTVADLPTGTHDIHSLLNHDGVLPKDERNKAALRLMSWCTFRMPNPLRELLARLGDACAQPDTEDGDLVLLASRHGAMVETVGDLKAWLTGQLHCWVGQQHLQNYQGVVGSFLMDLALPITIYLLDYFLPQLAPTEHCVDTLDVMAAPVRYSPQPMTFTLLREDVDFVYYAFTNQGGNVMVMTPGYADQCNNYLDYVQYYDGKPLEVGRMIAILFEQAEPPEQYAVVGLITDIKARNRPERLKKADQATQATPEFAREVILSKCNAMTYEVALLRGLALEFFAAGACAAIRRRYHGLQMHELTGNVLPHHVRVFDVFALGLTKPVKELLAVAHTPSSRRPRGLGIHCMPDTATAMIPARKAVLQSLLTTLLRRFLTPGHQKMNIPHDDWFRAIVLPIVAESDGHVLATVCAMAFSIATGKLDLSIQGLFGAGKSRAAAILIAGLLALDPERRLRYQLICKENTGTKSFIEVLIYLQLPAEVFKRVGRLISDGEANKPGQSTSKDLPHTVRQKRMPECDLLVMTGGTHTSDRTSYWPRLAEWQHNLAFTVVDEAQQFGTDREVTAIAMLPPTSFILWTGDAQQTPGGIAKGDTQFARSRQQLMSRRHALRCPQKELTPHKLHTALLNHLADVDLPSVNDFQEMFAAAKANPGPIWVGDIDTDQAKVRQQLQQLYPNQELSWREATMDEHQALPMTADPQLLKSHINPTSIVCFAYICMSLETNPEWLPAIQAQSNVDTAGCAGAFSWGLMLPTSTRTAGVTYTSIVGVRYDMLCELLNGEWRIGTHTLGGVDGLVGGFQFVHWYKPQKYYQYSRNCDLLAVIEPLFQALRATHDDASLLVMSANNDDRDTMRKWDLAQDKAVAFNSVASSAGSTATMAVVVQSAMGHLNGWPSYPFDQEECYARATVAATRSQSLTVILSQIDMMGIIGMIQVLAARAHPIQEVYQATSNWTMPELRAGETQLEQSDREIASWRLNHAGHWQEQTEPPLSVVYLKTKVGGKSADMKPVRLRLILVSAADVRGAENWLGPLKTCRDSGQIYPWMPRQKTESLLLWACATDGDSRPFLWLGPKSAEDAQTMTLRHWLLNKEVPTFPLPGIYFFDAWRIKPGLEIPAKLSLGLTAVDLRHDEEMPPQPTAQDTSHGDRLLRRQEVLTARADAKLLVGLPIEFYDGNVKGLKNQSWCEQKEMKGVLLLLCESHSLGVNLMLRS